MTAAPFELFGKRATLEKDFLEIAARLGFQGESEKHLLHYLLQRLELTPEDTLLEIGCGAGNLLIPLSFFVESAAGIDHKNLLAKLAQRIPYDTRTVKLIPGDFLKARVRGKYSKVLIYSVLHYMRDEGQVLAFVRKAARLVRPGGLLFIGDIPNADLKRAFLSSANGRAFTREWKKKEAAYRASTPSRQNFKVTVPLVTINDALIRRIVRELRAFGIRASILRQPKELGFSCTRVDIAGKRKD